MPKIKFTDTAIKKLAVEKTTWFSDPTAKGLQLCVTKAGVKTWYVNKWDSGAQKTRRVKLAQWATKGTHCRWAKEQVGKVMLDVKEGNVRTREEQREAAAATKSLPTFGAALEQMIEFKSNPERMNKSGKRSMADTTVSAYRGSFNKHLIRWADVPVDELPIFEIATHLNDLQNEKREAAQRAANVASSVIKWVGRVASIDLPVPKLVDPTRHRSRAESGGDIDMTVPLADRWADIQTVENEHKRLALELTTFTALRGRPLLALTWDRVYRVTLEDGREAWAVNLDKPVKKSPEDREVVLGDDAGRIIERLLEIRFDDCEWVFPSRRIVGGERGHLDAIDRFGDTTTNMLRHYWMPIARTHVELATAKWLALHSMKQSGFGMMGHYGTPSLLEQHEAGNIIASKVNQELGRASTNVVAMA